MNLKGSSRDMNSRTSTSHGKFGGRTAGWTDKYMALEIVKQNGGFLRLCSEELRNDRDVVLASLSNDPSCVIYVGEDLMLDSANILGQLMRVKGDMERYFTDFKPKIGNHWERMVINALIKRAGFDQQEEFLVFQD